MRLTASRFSYWSLVIAIAVAAFVMGPTLAAASSEHVLHDFLGLDHVRSSLPDAGRPDGPLLEVGGAFYGTSASGGAHGLGAIYELRPPAHARARWTSRVIYSFDGNDGTSPQGHLLFRHGALYGTTGDAFDPVFGTVFRLTPGTGGWTHETLYTFKNSPLDGGAPQDGVIAVGNALFGTNAGCAHCGPAQFGTVYRLEPPTNGNGTWRKTTLHDFSGGADGGNPVAGVVYRNGQLFGTAATGGASNAGVVFSLAPARNAWQLTVLHAFTGFGDGGAPAEITAGNGALFGVASYGGSWNGGVVFAETLGPSGWFFSVEHGFAGGAEGSVPTGSIVARGNVLYGTTFYGGAAGQGLSQGYGTVFSIQDSFTMTTLHAFGDAGDATGPTGGLIPYAGLLVGVGSGGGTLGNGAAFAVRP